MAQGEREEQQHLSDYVGHGGGWGARVGGGELDNAISEQHVTFRQQ